MRQPHYVANQKSTLQNDWQSQHLPLLFRPATTRISLRGERQQIGERLPRRRSPAPTPRSLSRWATRFFSLSRSLSFQRRPGARHISGKEGAWGSRSPEWRNSSIAEIWLPRLWNSIRMLTLDGERLFANTIKSMAGASARRAPPALGVHGLPSQPRLHRERERQIESPLLIAPMQPAAYTYIYTRPLVLFARCRPWRTFRGAAAKWAALGFISARWAWRPPAKSAPSSFCALRPLSLARRRCRAICYGLSGPRL